MSIEDRDWFREDYRERERKYGGDFSLHSTLKNRPGRPEKRNGNALPIALLNIFAAFSCALSLYASIMIEREQLNREFMAVSHCGNSMLDSVCGGLQ